MSQSNDDYGQKLYLFNIDNKWYDDWWYTDTGQIHNFKCCLSSTPPRDINLKNCDCQWVERPMLLKLEVFINIMNGGPGKIYGI